MRQASHEVNTRLNTVDWIQRIKRFILYETHVEQDAEGFSGRVRAVRKEQSAERLSDDKKKQTAMKN